jgi:hypothetical protein
MAEPGNTRQSCRDGVCWSWMDGDWSWRERRRERAGCGVSRGVCGLVGVRDTTPEPHPAPTGTTRRGRTGYSAGLGRWGARRPRSEKKGSISTNSQNPLRGPWPAGRRRVWGCGPFFEHSTHIRLSAQAPAQGQLRALAVAHSNPGLEGSLPTPLRNGSRGRRGVALAVSCAVEDANNNKRACKRLLPGLVTDRLWSR